MPATLSELCKYIQSCTEKLEEEIKHNIEDCHRMLLVNEATETKLALEKAKDYHYKEILDFLRNIIVDVKKIMFHEEKIRALNDEKSLSLEELKRYSHVQRQISIFSNQEEMVTKREKRRVASEISIGSLEAWEHYLEKKAQEEKVAAAEKAEISKRKRPNSKRRRKKFVSSTFDDFLEAGGRAKKLDSILEGDVQEEREAENGGMRLSTEEPKQETKQGSNHEYNRGDVTNINIERKDADIVSYNSEDDLESMEGNKFSGRTDSSKYSLTNIVEAISNELCLEESQSKPKIVDVVYKKKT